MNPLKNYSSHLAQHFYVYCFKEIWNHLIFVKIIEPPKRGLNEKLSEGDILRQMCENSFMYIILVVGSKEQSVSKRLLLMAICAIN